MYYEEFWAAVNYFSFPLRERWNVGKSKCFCNVITYKQSSTHHFQGDQAAAGGILPTVNTL